MKVEKLMTFRRTWVLPVRNFMKFSFRLADFPLPECFGELLEQGFVVAASFLKQTLCGTPCSKTLRLTDQKILSQVKVEVSNLTLNLSRGSRRFKPPVTDTAIFIKSTYFKRSCGVSFAKCFASSCLDRYSGSFAQLGTEFAFK